MRSVLGFPRVVDDVSIRIVAGVVLTTVVLALATGWWWLFTVLAVDFWLRLASGPRFSPVAHLVLDLIRPRVPAAPRETPGAPKRFATGMGTVVTTAIAVLLATGLDVAGYVLLAALLAFAALEAFLGFCVGCRIFAVGMRLGLVPEEVCADCADIWARQRRLADR